MESRLIFLHPSYSYEIILLYMLIGLCVLGMIFLEKTIAIKGPYRKPTQVDW